MNTFTVDGITTIVRTDDAVFAKYGIPGYFPAAMVENIAGAPHPVVYITTGFGELSQESQRAVMAHEAGHVACGHLDIYAEEGVLYDNTEVEAQADAWAVKAVGQDVFERALEETLVLIKRQLGDSLTPEIEAEMQRSLVERLASSQK